MEGISGMKKVLIIGGGPAGLTAAYELARKGGVEVLVFERETQLGGRRGEKRPSLSLPGRGDAL